MADIRTQYQAHIAAVLALAQLPEADGARGAHLRARAAHRRGALEPPGHRAGLKGNNHWKTADFAQRAPGLDWSAYFAAAGLAQQDEFVVWQPSALRGISALTASEPLETWKDWLRFHLLEHEARPICPRRSTPSTSTSTAQVLSGTPQQPPRWKRAVDETNNALGEAVGKLYVQRYFPAEREGACRGPGEESDRRFRRAHRSPGVDGAADARARQGQARCSQGRRRLPGPLAQLRRAGGAARGDAFGNAGRAERFELEHNLEKLGTPVDRSEWAMMPQEVNAVNLPAMNALNFPAGILQPPYFDPPRVPR